MFQQPLHWIPWNLVHSHLHISTWRMNFTKPCDLCHHKVKISNFRCFVFWLNICQTNKSGHVGSQIKISDSVSIGSWKYLTQQLQWNLSLFLHKYDLRCDPIFTLLITREVIKGNQLNKWDKNITLHYLFMMENYPNLNICLWPKYVNLCLQ